MRLVVAFAFAVAALLPPPAAAQPSGQGVRRSG